MATNGAYQNQAAELPAGGPASADLGANSGSSNGDVSKDEVGWFFVSQYYTTLSKTPEKLHLFYGKQSQFVFGLEATVSPVSVGRQAIQERIKKLNYQDCKVRISNVDSQASSDSIVVQVIGEISNSAGQEPKKFVQTFILAQQPTGYFVLNDILRYIDEEGEADNADALAQEPKAEEVPEPAEPVAVEPPKDDAAELNAQVVDQKLEEAAAPAVEAEAVPEPAEASQPEITSTEAEATAAAIAEEDIKEPEKPSDPSPTPAAPAAKPAPAAEAPPPEPTGPPKPMTWASRAAAAAGPRPVVPLPKTATPPAQSQARGPAPAAATTAAPAAPAAAPAAVPAPAAQATTAPAQAQAPPADVSKDGWQTAGSDSKRQRPQSISAAPVDKENTLGYVKFVTDKVQESDLKSALEAHGELSYFDINRQKNCAFVEYKTVEGYNTALASNPHVVNGENIIVEQRRPKASAYGGTNYGPRGGQRGRGGFDGGRSGGQGNPRGSFGGQSRGRGAPRGRGGAQAANA